jgi:hypothetical protein
MEVQKSLDRSTVIQTSSSGFSEAFHAANRYIAQVFKTVSF